MPSDPPIPADPTARNTAPGSGGAPQGGWAPLAPEFSVTDIRASLTFWCDLLGFTIAFDRPLARFAYLQRERLQVMLCERNGRWEPAEMQRPFGRGINIQMEVPAIAPILAALHAAGWPIYEGPTEAWYRAGPQETGRREFLVQDPDGYMLLLAEDLGLRAPT